MDVLDDARALIEAQLRSLDDEEARLRRTLRHLGEEDDPEPTRRSPRPAGRHSTKSRKAPARRAAKGERRDQFMQCIADVGRDGITVGEIARRIGLSTPNSLYPLGQDLLKLGAVSREGSRYYPVGVKPPEGKA